MSFDVVPPQPVNTLPVQGPQPVAGQAAGNPLPLTPPGGAQSDPDFVTAREAADAADAAIQQAQQRYDQLLGEFQKAQQAAQDPANINAATQLQSATSAFDTAQRDLANANTASANAKAKMVAAAEAAASRAKDPDLKNYYTAHAQQAQAGADLAKAQGAALAAKTPAEVAQANAAATEAIARAGALGILTPAQAAQANADAAQKSATAAQISALTPGLAREQAAKATITEAQAGVAPQAAQAALAKTQADVDQAKATVDETRRRISGMPTEQQAQAAIDLGLKDKQADLDAKQAQLEQARKLMPLAVGQAGANIAATEAGTAATLAGVGQKTLGPLYGIGDQISRYRDMIASGQINPQDADTALNTYLNTQVTGATPFQAGQEQNRYQEAIRQQDVGLAENRLNAAQQYAGTAFGQFAQMAASAGPGHGQEAAQAYADTLAQGQRFFGQMGGMVTPPAAPSAVSQAPVVHINIGGGQPTSAPQPTAAPGLPAAPPALPATVAAAPPVAPATPDWFGAWQQRQAADAAAQQAVSGITAAPAEGGGDQTPADPMQAHQDRWADELASGAVTMPGEPQPQEATAG